MRTTWSCRCDTTLRSGWVCAAHNEPQLPLSPSGTSRPGWTPLHPWRWQVQLEPCIQRLSEEQGQAMVRAQQQAAPLETELK